MFNGTLRMNLDPEGLTSDDIIFKLIEDAQLKELIEKDPKGLY
jgi:hypothetical protein